MSASHENEKIEMIAYGAQNNAAHNARRQRQLRTNALERQTSFSGSTQEFNAETGEQAIRLRDGSRVFAQATTNGGVEAGEFVTVNRPRGGQARYKAMPR